MSNYKQYDPLITASEVIDKTFTNKNTDPVLISNNTIILAELAHLRPILGDKFYGGLKEQHDSSGTLSTDNQTLMDFYVDDVLCWFVRFEVVNEIMNNITSSGIVTNIDDFSRVLSRDDYNAYKQDTYRKAELFAQDMERFLNHKDQRGKYNTYETNKPNAMKAYKNHGMIFYDSIYKYNGVADCDACGSQYNYYKNCFCDDNCNDC